MRLRSLVLTLLLLAVGAFAWANWAALLAPASLSVFFTTFEAPLGLVMLCMLALVAGAFALNMLIWQGRILADNRRHAKELEHQRSLADQTEASRLLDLKGVLQDRIAGLTTRLEEMEAALRTEIHETGNAMIATVSEMDDRLTKSGR